MEESFYFFPKPLWKLCEGAEWKEASLHRLRSILGRTPDLQGTRGLISWSGNTIAYTCNVFERTLCDLMFSMSHIMIINRMRTWMFSMSSELSQRMDESFTLLISAN